RRDLGHPQRRLDLHRRQAPEGQDQGRQGRAARAGHRACGAHAGRAGRAVRAVRRPAALDHEVQQERQARQGLPPLAAPEGELREVVRGKRGVLGRLDQGRGRAPDVGQGRQAAAGLPAGRAQDVRLRASRPGVGQGHRGVHQVHHRRHVREGRAGHEGRGGGEVGRERAQEDLRRMSDPTPRRGSMERRAFLKVTGVAGILAAQRAPAFAQGTKLHWLRWNDFVPAGDVVLRQQIVEAGKALGAEIQLETINANDLQPRITAAIQSGSGADLIMTLHNWPHLYAASLADVTDVAEWLAKDQGGDYGESQKAAKDGTAYLGGPGSISGLMIASRKSWFADAGAAAPPKTLDEYRQLGMKLKKKGHPLGQTLGPTFGAAPAWAYPLVWNFGGAETDKQGRARLDGKETVESVK